jgi:hypothetical protein
VAAEKTKKQSRPRLDAILRHIKAGSYDEEMSQLQGAIADRQRIRQEAVLGLVKEAFGDEFVVTKPTTSPPFQRPTPAPQEDWEQAAARAEAEEAALKDSLGDAAEGQDDPMIESRSPIIGSVDTGAAVQERDFEGEERFEDTAEGGVAEAAKSKGDNPFTGMKK